MPSNRRSIWLVLAVAMAALLGPVARGQERLFKDDVASNLTLRQAAEEAKRTHKVLIARFALPPPPQGRRPMWENDTVKAWVKWHAIVVDVDGEEEATLKASYGYGEAERKWGAYYFANDKRFKLYWPRTFWLPSPLPDRRSVFKPGMQESLEQHWPTALMAVHQFQLNFERASAAMPVWGTQHIRGYP